MDGKQLQIGYPSTIAAYSGSENSGSENSGSENSGSENSGSENSGSENSGSDKPTRSAGQYNGALVELQRLLTSRSGTLAKRDARAVARPIERAACEANTSAALSPAALSPAFAGNITMLSLRRLVTVAQGWLRTVARGWLLCGPPFRSRVIFHVILCIVLGGMCLLLHPGSVGAESRGRAENPGLTSPLPADLAAFMETFSTY